MRILYITGEDLSEIGGSATHILEVARGFRNLGHDVTIIARERGTHTKDIDMVTAPMRVGGKTAPILGFTKLIFKKKYDIILERFAVLGGIGTILSKMYKIPLVLEINGPHLEEAIEMGQITSPFMKSVLRTWVDTQYAQANKILVISNAKENKYKKALLGKYEKKGMYLHNGATIENISTKQIATLRKRYHLNGKCSFIFVGSFKPWMGVLDLVKAVSILKKKDKKTYGSCKFLIVGKGKEFPSVKAFVDEQKLENCILTGGVDHKTAQHLISAADIAIAPFNAAEFSAMDTFGFYFSPAKIFEYMASGKPIITTDYPELRWVVHKEGGFLFPSGKISLLAKTLAKAVQSKNKFSAMGAYNKKRFLMEFTWEQCAKKQVKLFKEILREQHG